MKIKNYISNVSERIAATGQYVSALFLSPSRAQGQIMLFLMGITLLGTGLVMEAIAQTGAGDIDASAATYNSERLNESLQVIFGYLEGSFGALIMVSAGIGAILSSAFGQYRAALGLLVVAVGAFILRSLTTAFFNVGADTL